jgi:hypothetical protein
MLLNLTQEEEEDNELRGGSEGVAMIKRYLMYGNSERRMEIMGRNEDFVTLGESWSRVMLLDLTQEDDGGWRER